MPPPKQNPITASFTPGARRCSSSSPARRSAIMRSGGACAERRRGVPVGRHRRRAAFLGQQVDRERGVAVGGQTWRDRADVRGQPAVLVDHEHGTLRLRRPWRRRRSVPLAARRSGSPRQRRRWLPSTARPCVAAAAEPGVVAATVDAVVVSGGADVALALGAVPVVDAVDESSLPHAASSAAAAGAVTPSSIRRRRASRRRHDAIGAVEHDLGRKVFVEGHFEIVGCRNTGLSFVGAAWVPHRHRYREEAHVRGNEGG